MDMYQDVLDFHRALGVYVGTTPQMPGTALRKLRMDLEREEFQELAVAVAREDVPEIADALADLIYVFLGTAITYGIDLRPVWEEVHRTNMAKKGGGKRVDGKIQKPVDWVKPDVAGVLAKQKSL